MTAIPKHEASHRKGATKRLQPATVTPAPVVNVDADMSGVECALADLASAVGRYVNRAADGDGGNSLHLYTGPEGSGYHPVVIALDPCGEATEDLIAIGGRIATAFERIADAVAGKAAPEPEKS